MRGYSSVIYLDDLLCLGESSKECEAHLHLACDLFQSLGLVINWKKSNLTPKTSCKYLGFILDSSQMILKLPPEKKADIIALLQGFEKKQYCKIREFANLIGVLVATCPGVEYGPLYCKSLERAKLKALNVGGMDFESRMKIPEDIRKDLKWWKDTLPSAKRQIRKFKYVREIFSDACLTGWGAFWAGKGSNGEWSLEEKRLDINHLELKAALLALKSFANDLTDCEILLRVDNTTALAYINKMGGAMFNSLHELAREFWNWCEDRRLWVFAAYIASKDNIEADTLSRKINEDTEWGLADEAFQQITIKFGRQDIDLFASRKNTKCETFCAWGRDPDALVSDAFTICWSELRFYAFPPFAIIAKVLQKIRNDKASGILVVPLWTHQAWFPLFQKLAQGKWLQFNPNPDLLVSSFRSQQHPLAAKLTLVAAKLSARHF